MPLLKGAVTYSRFRAEHHKEPTKDPRRSLANALRKGAFEPLDQSGEQDRSAGWVELEDHQATDLAPSRFLYGSYLLATWRVDSVRVPAALVRSEIDAWSRAFEEKIGHPPKRADKSAQKEIILKKLRRRAFVSTQTFDVSWNLDTNAVQLWASSKKIVEEIQVAIEEAFDVTLHSTSPGARVDASDVDVDKIRATPELFGDDVALQVR
ncbi:MAG: recombination-associated protein RdgC [Deltaproteobacteria bacterium]|jgi:recombination associated protein RdgC